MCPVSLLSEFVIISYTDVIILIKNVLQKFLEVEILDCITALTMEILTNKFIVECAFRSGILLEEVGSWGHDLKCAFLSLRPLFSFYFLAILKSAAFSHHASTLCYFHLGVSQP